MDDMEKIQVFIFSSCAGLSVSKYCQVGMPTRVNFFVAGACSRTASRALTKSSFDEGTNTTLPREADRLSDTAAKFLSTVISRAEPPFDPSLHPVRKALLRSISLGLEVRTTRQCASLFRLAAALPICRHCVSEEGRRRMARGLSRNASALFMETEVTGMLRSMEYRLTCFSTGVPAETKSRSAC